jgi:hypothetical protein
MRCFSIQSTAAANGIHIRTCVVQRCRVFDQRDQRAPQQVWQRQRALKGQLLPAHWQSRKSSSIVNFKHGFSTVFAASALFEMRARLKCSASDAGALATPHAAPRPAEFAAPLLPRPGSTKAPAAASSPFSRRLRMVPSCSLASSGFARYVLHCIYDENFVRFSCIRTLQNLPPP